MDQRFTLHNLFRNSEKYFAEHDPHLRNLNRQKLVFRSSLLDSIHAVLPGIYTLSGGRQVGKTTFLKQFIQTLLQGDILPRQIYFISCELISDFKDLYHVIEMELAKSDSSEHRCLFIDEITYVPQWHRAIKQLADTGQLDNVFVMISGSDSVIIKDMIKQIPGRRGTAVQLDYQYNPLLFSDFVLLRNNLQKKWVKDVSICSQESLFTILTPDKIESLFAEFSDYCMSGGYLTAVNDLARNGRVEFGTFRTYSDWIRGDLLKRNKSETYLKEIIQAIIRRYGSQISWNNLAADLSIDHPATVSDYIQIMESMDAVVIQPALREDNLTQAPKKAKKVYFSDPFIFFALNAWIEESANPYDEIVAPIMNNPETVSCLVESIVVNHFRRCLPTYYIKGKGEIDVAVLINKKIQPVEVKWRGQIRPGDLKELLRFPNGIIASKTNMISTISNMVNLPLPVLLLRVKKICQTDI